MNCPTCHKPMDTSMDKHYKTWTCNRCGWKLCVESWAAMEFYWKNNVPIDDVITIDKTKPDYHDIAYYSPVIRDERKFVSGDIGDLITSKLENGKKYKILIDISERTDSEEPHKHSPKDDDRPMCDQICADPDLVVIATRWGGTDEKATAKKRRSGWERIINCPLRKTHKCKHTISTEYERM